MGRHVKPEPPDENEYWQWHADSEIERHAQKQGCSRSDAWRYFEREGFDMSWASPQY